MNEPLSPDSSNASTEPLSADRVPSSPSPSGSRPARGVTPMWRHPLFWLLVIALGVLGWQWSVMRTDMLRTREELARRLNETDGIVKAARDTTRQSEEGLQKLQARVEKIDMSLAVSQSQQAALEALYKEFSSARDDRSLTEVEQMINIAAEQLQIAGNVPAALSALQNADARLAQQNHPQYLPLRKLLARDIEQIKALPLADVTNVSLQLEAMLGRVDALHMAFERTAQTSPATASAPVVAPDNAKKRQGKTAVAQSAPASSPVAQSEPAAQPSGFTRAVHALWNDLIESVTSQIRIERLDRPDPVLLSPQQSAYLRENLRLRLMSARLALLQRNGKVFNEDVSQARAWLDKYFDGQSAPVANMVEDLKQMESAQLNVDLPTLDETLSVLRNLRVGSGSTSTTSSSGG